MKDLISLLNKINELFYIFDKKRRYQIFIILIINIFNGFLEYLTLISVSIFLSALSDPKNILDKYQIVPFLKSNDEQYIVFISTLIFGFVIVFSSITRIINLWINMKYRNQLIIYLEKKAYSNLLSQDYSYHINTNSSDLLTILTTDIEKTNFFIENLQTLITSIFISLSLVIGLINLNIMITSYSIFIFLVLYLILGKYTNKKVKIFSQKESKANSELIRTISESLGSIRELILSGNLDFIINKFSKSSNSLRFNQGLNAFITTFSRFAFEGIGLLVIALIGFSIFNLSENNNVIALLGTFALGSLKLLPSMQSIYRSYSLLFFYKKPLEKVLKILNLSSKVKSKENKYRIINYQSFIELENLSFNYLGTKNKILNKINLKISRRERIGIIGSTGSGKTTLINILMGLLEPTEGTIKIDNKYIFKNQENKKYNWTNNFTLVPQEIYLYDATIFENIAFNVNIKNIKKEKVIEAAKLACAHDFIKARPLNYKTLTGEKGIQFSGGQRQRIGIARAIYSNSKILILDEATNALDKQTEYKVIESLLAIKDITIISIAHNIDSLRSFDKIIELRNGSIENIFFKKEFSNMFYFSDNFKK